MNLTRESHKQALRQLLDRYGIERVDGSYARREKLLDEALALCDRFHPARFTREES